MLITVLIADDNVELAEVLSSYLTKDKAIKIVNIATNGESAISSYLTYSPDVMILDLKMPQKNGIQVLDTLCTLNASETNKCNIIVTSGNLADFKFRFASKVFRVFEKPFDLSALHDCIYQVYNATQEKPSYRKLCEDTVLQLGFSYTNLGTGYIIDILEHLSKNNTTDFSMNDLYTHIAQKNGITVRKAKWNIEKAIESMCRFSRTEDLRRRFPYYDGRKPTPKYTIAMALYKLSKLK